MSFAEMHDARPEEQKLNDAHPEEQELDPGLIGQGAIHTRI